MRGPPLGVYISSNCTINQPPERNDVLGAFSAGTVWIWNPDHRNLIQTQALGLLFLSLQELTSAKEQPFLGFWASIDAAGLDNGIMSRTMAHGKQTQP